ncbi:MAG: hypothetical protein JJ863_28475 [Deltaproteobacteria bacterium]|nr:hypothetical protein [Deltaproteobacteria bacterium]
MSAPPDPRVGTAGATLTSVAIHAFIYWVIVTYGTVPELDFEFEMPTEIELGMTDAMEAAPAQPSAPVEPPSEPNEDTTDAEGEGAETEDVPDAGPPRPDAGPPDAGVPDAGPPDGGAPLVAETTGDADEESTLPAGAQIAIRIDMARVRSSALNDDIRRLMAAIPDWQLLLDGSGIDPIDDLDRLLIASPNLQRSQMVLAGRHAHPDEGQQYVRDVVARFAEARGVEASWTQRHGVPVAPWPNEDTTERVVAIVGPRHFVIARPQDLPTILAIALAREQAGEDEDDEDEVERVRGPDALLSMGPEEAFSVEVEGARNFVRGRVQHIPERLRIAVSEEPDKAVLKGRARYEDEATAAAALTYWEGQRDRYSRALLVGGYVRGLELAADGRHVTIEHRLSFGQARLLISFAQGAMQSRARNRARSSSTMEPAEPSEPPEATE